MAEQILQFGESLRKVGLKAGRLLQLFGSDLAGDWNQTRDGHPLL